MRAAANGRNHRQMQRPSLVARKPFAERACRVDADVDVHITECAAFGLEHAVRREIAKTTAQTSERFAERRRGEVHRDVAFGLHAEQGSEPSRLHRMTGKSPERVSTGHDVAHHRVFRMLVPVQVRVESVSNCGDKIVADDAHVRSRRAPRGDRVACAHAASRAAESMRASATSTWRVWRFPSRICSVQWRCIAASRSAMRTFDGWRIRHRRAGAHGRATASGSAACGTSGRTTPRPQSCAPGRARRCRDRSSRAPPTPGRRARSGRCRMTTERDERGRGGETRQLQRGQDGHGLRNSLADAAGEAAQRDRSRRRLLETHKPVRVLRGDHRLVIGDLGDQLPAEVGHRLAHVGLGPRSIDDVPELVAQSEPAQCLGAAIRVLHAARSRHHNDEDVIARAEGRGVQRRQLRGNVENDEVETLHVQLAQDFAQESRRDGPLRVDRALRSEQHACAGGVRGHEVDDAPVVRRREREIQQRLVRRAEADATLGLRRSRSTSATFGEGWSSLPAGCEQAREFGCQGASAGAAAQREEGDAAGAVHASWWRGGAVAESPQSARRLFRHLSPRWLARVERGPRQRGELVRWRRHRERRAASARPAYRAGERPARRPTPRPHPELRGEDRPVERGSPRDASAIRASRPRRPATRRPDPRTPAAVASARANTPRALLP